MTPSTMQILSVFPTFLFFTIRVAIAEQQLPDPAIEKSAVAGHNPVTRPSIRALDTYPRFAIGDSVATLPTDPPTSTVSVPRGISNAKRSELEAFHSNHVRKHGRNKKRTNPPAPEFTQGSIVKFGSQNLIIKEIVVSRIDPDIVLPSLAEAVNAPAIQSIASTLGAYRKNGQKPSTSIWAQSVGKTKVNVKYTTRKVKGYSGVLLFADDTRRLIEQALKVMVTGVLTGPEHLGGVRGDDGDTIRIVFKHDKDISATSALEFFIYIRQN